MVQRKEADVTEKVNPRSGDRMRLHATSPSNDPSPWIARCFWHVRTHVGDGAGSAFVSGVVVDRSGPCPIAIIGLGHSLRRLRKGLSPSHGRCGSLCPQSPASPSRSSPIQIKRSLTLWWGNSHTPGVRRGACESQVVGGGGLGEMLNFCEILGSSLGE
jgi:hypothetical protein